MSSALSREFERDETEDLQPRRIGGSNHCVAHNGEPGNRFPKTAKIARHGVRHVVAQAMRPVELLRIRRVGDNSNQRTGNASTGSNRVIGRDISGHRRAKNQEILVGVRRCPVANPVSGSNPLLGRRTLDL
jgi:hypothetical protein